MAKVDDPIRGPIQIKAASSGYQISHVGRILGIVFVPAPIQKLTIVFNRLACDKYHVAVTANQVSCKRLVIVRCRFQSVDHLR